MKALISNDDGITASGILASKKAVENLCETYVIAPETQQSGIGHALTLYEPLRVNEHTLKDGSKGMCHKKCYYRLKRPAYASLFLNSLKRITVQQLQSQRTCGSLNHELRMQLYHQP